MLQDNMGYH